MNDRQPPDSGRPTPPAGQGTPPEEETEHRVTVYEALGGQQYFDHLVERFYARVADDDVLLPLYPEQDDLGPARQRLALFLGQYWGGPQAYSELRGHPRLRMRHEPFAIAGPERDHWLAAMDEAVKETIGDTPLEPELQREVAARMTEYFTMAADHMVNR